ncbi:MAG: ribokinase [Anaerococcus sp.]|nr:ribokinase [Anaerococcus sp.]
MKILNFGSMNLDFFYRVKNIVRPGETISSNSLEVKMGGKGLNQSIALSKNCDFLYHAGLIGDDGYKLKEILEENGVDTRFIKKVGERTGNAIIQLEDSGENSIVLYPGANHLVTKEYIDQVLDEFTGEDYLVIQNEINNISYIIDKAYEKGMKIFLNPSPITKDLLDADLSKVYMFILNKSEGISLCGNKELIVKSLREKYPKSKFVLTSGKDGSMYFDKDRLIKQDAYLVDVVDTTGAGDTFTGFFITSYIKDKDIKKSLKLAALASSLCVMKKGAANAIPSLEEVLDFKEKI